MGHVAIILKHTTQEKTLPVVGINTAGFLVVTVGCFVVTLGLSVCMAGSVSAVAIIENTLTLCVFLI